MSTDSCDSCGDNGTRPSLERDCACVDVKTAQYELRQIHGVAVLVPVRGGWSPKTRKRAAWATRRPGDHEHHFGRRLKRYRARLNIGYSKDSIYRVDQIIVFYKHVLNPGQPHARVWPPRSSESEAMEDATNLWDEDHYEDDEEYDSEQSSSHLSTIHLSATLRLHSGYIRTSSLNFSSTLVSKEVRQLILGSQVDAKKGVGPAPCGIEPEPKEFRSATGYY
ncbi:hypothetical protein BGW80DRAFT_1252270 [Lactifluus volemus]|nr:hypothetical protein BGW80DRAFT_1252270 [Lactifluus volemus]